MRDLYLNRWFSVSLVAIALLWCSVGHAESLKSTPTQAQESVPMAEHMTSQASVQSIAEAQEHQQKVAPVEVLPLLKEKVCMSCHQMDKKRVGPSLMMIAERYADQDEAFVITLRDRIKQGGKGHWGPVAMPVQNKLSDEDAETMARWILSLAVKDQKATQVEASQTNGAVQDGPKQEN